MRNLDWKRVRRVFNALMIASIGFGAHEALASPAAPAAGYCTRVETAECNYTCQETLGFTYRGSCTKTSFGTVSCQCFSIVDPESR